MVEEGTLRMWEEHIQFEIFNLELEILKLFVRINSVDFPVRNVLSWRKMDYASLL